MKQVKLTLQQRIARALNICVRKSDADRSVTVEQILIETPPRKELGDIAFPMFPYAKILKNSPNNIAEEVKTVLETDETVRQLGTVSSAGPYINIALQRDAFSSQVLRHIMEEGEDYGRSEVLSKQKMMIEFSCPNTNKPLHLGHLRNDAIGESVAGILEYNGADVMKVNLINDRGIHICKSMLAYQKFGNSKTPEIEGIKGDHFVGNFYVRYNRWAKEDSSAEDQARELLRKWEQGEDETTKLWHDMNDWAISGILETYKRTGVRFDKIYYESETYKKGREEVLRGLEAGIFTQDESGTVWVDLAEIGLDKKVLLRADGTTLYLTQDIGTAIDRRDDWPFDRHIYVVGTEQQYHFAVLFHILKKLGYDWADNLYHLAYGMVNLPEGKMKSREGTVVDADELLDELHTMARQEIVEKGREREVEDIEQTAESIALGALHYFLLQVNPAKDMVFNPKESISFNGNTGPYLQYTGARISTMLEKYRQKRAHFEHGRFVPEYLIVEEEWAIIKLLGSFGEYVEQAAEELNPSIIAVYLFELAKTFSHYYHENPVLHNDDADVVVTRVTLVESILRVLKNGFALLGIPFLEAM